MIRIAVLVSGSGTNLQALLDSEANGTLSNGSIVLVVSDRTGVFALKRSEMAGIPALVLDRKTLGKRAFEQQLLDVLERQHIDLIVLAGFLTILSEKIIRSFEKRIINIHPSLIPSFCGKGYYGLRVHQAALERGVKLSGATVHLVDEVPDGGPILAQQAIEVLPDDTPESLGIRILQEVEWKLLPKTVASYCLTLEKHMNMEAYLSSIRYPGRGILCGMNEEGKAIIAYFITARSSHSKNRCLVLEGNTVRTKALDESLVVDPSLIIYRAMDQVGAIVVVSNGDQSDTIIDGLNHGIPLEQSLSTRTFEPDAPNYTARISAIYNLGCEPSYTFSLLRHTEDGSCDRSCFSFVPKEGEAHLIHTYEGDGSPLPVFKGEPKRFRLNGNLQEIADRLWALLDSEYKVAVCVKEVDLTNNESTLTFRQGGSNGEH